MDSITPSKDEFLIRAKSGKILPLYAVVQSEHISPIYVLKSLRSSEFKVLLQSVQQDADKGRYSFVAADPYLIFKSRGENVEVSFPATPTGKYGRRSSMKRDALKKLQGLLFNYRTESVAALPPFTGGAIGYISYDFGAQRKEDFQVDSAMDIPETYFIFVDEVIAFDHVSNKTWVIVNPGAREQELGFRKPDPDQWARYYDEAEAKLKSTRARLEQLRGRCESATSDLQALQFGPTLSLEAYKAMIMKCKAAIAKGEVQWMHVSEEYTADLGEHDAISLYGQFQNASHPAFSSCLDFGDIQAIAASSEPLLQCPGSEKISIESIRSLLPAPSIVGESQKACKDLIKEIETLQRGLYGGCLGYFSNTGALDLNVISSVLCIKQGRAYLQMGTKIDKTSDAERSYSENLKTMLKH